MSLDYSKYDLEIVSLEPGHEGKTFKQYSINEDKTIGVFENEPFKICFRNKTAKKIQVKISIDGTDILTGEEASTAKEGRMWIVNAYGVLELKAWPETNQGGSSFLFGKAKNSVAANTHGNMSATGIIAVAVFEETHVPPQFNWYQTQINGNWSGSSGGGTYGSSGSFGAIKSDSRLRRSRMSFNDDDSLGEVGSAAGNVDYNATMDCNIVPISEVQTKAAVGAGEYVSQSIKNGVGLVAPKLGPVIQLKYEWWTSLKSKIREDQSKPVPFKGFPGDRQTFINLDNVPKVEKRQIRKKKHFQNRDKYIEYQRFI